MGCGRNGVGGENPETLLNADRLLSGEEVAKALGLAESANPGERIRGIYRSGALAAVKVQGHLRYRPEDVRDYIERCRIPASYEVTRSKQARAVASRANKGREKADRRNTRGPR